MKRILSIILAAVMIFTGTLPVMAAAENEHKNGTKTSPAKDMPAEGEYSIFAVGSNGAVVDAGDLDAVSTLTLTGDGTGTMTMADESMDITEWAVDGEKFSLVFADKSSASGTLSGGVIELDIWGNGSLIYYYAKEGADTSSYAPMTLEEYNAMMSALPDSRLYALWSDLDTAAGVHLNYDRHVDYMDSDQSFDVHGKDGVYYSHRTTYVSGYENTVVTFFRDGTAYNLYPKDMTGVIATTTTSSYIAENIMSMDNLYSDIRQYAQKTDYTEETRELDGVSYTAEVFPATEYTPEAAFYFNDDGELAYYIAGAPVVESAIDIGESVYTIHTIDDAVDEALFDISGYDIAE